MTIVNADIIMVVVLGYGVAIMLCDVDHFYAKY